MAGQHLPGFAIFGPRGVAGADREERAEQFLAESFTDARITDQRLALTFWSRRQRHDPSLGALLLAPAARILLDRVRKLSPICDPVTPAAMIAASARYGLADASEAFNSTFACPAPSRLEEGTKRSAASRFSIPQNAKALAK